MISEFVREQKRYTMEDLCGIFRCSPEEAVPVIRKLREHGVLKAVPASPLQKDMSDLADEDIQVADVEPEDDKYYYVFTFVGVITVAGVVLKCYPKYLLHNSSPKKELRQVLKVLEKYDSGRQIVRTFSESSEISSFNLISILLFLLNDYYENGLYSNTRDTIESNGSGEILWDKTVNETFTLISGGRPYYTDLQTRKRVDDDFNYFRRLHRSVLSEASKELEDADLLELFDIAGVDFYDEDTGDLGERDYILYRIEKELNVQFNTRKQLLLKTLYAYIAHGGSLNDADALSMLGTSSFNLVWENVCADIMDNRLYSTLDSLPLPMPPGESYNKDSKLIDIIERPLWSATGERAADTLIPDIVSIYCDKFVIFDAKYYSPVLEPGQPPRSQPGIESVAKQYLYQLAYRKFIDDHGFAGTKNCFLLPSEKDEITDKGTVSLEILNGLGLESIEVRMLSASTAYDCYLSGRKMDISELAL